MKTDLANIEQNLDRIENFSDSKKPVFTNFSGQNRSLSEH